MREKVNYLGGFEVVGRNKRSKLEAKGFHVNSAVPFYSFAIEFRSLTASCLLHLQNLRILVFLPKTQMTSYVVFGGK